MIPSLWAVAAGGALGALARYGIAEAVRLGTRLEGWVAVLLANLVGTALLAAAAGAVASGAWAPSADAWAFSAVGFCGALTTYSAFGLDTVMLWYEGRRVLAAAQMFGSLAAGCAVVLLVQRTIGASA